MPLARGPRCVPVRLWASPHPKTMEIQGISEAPGPHDPRSREAVGGGLTRPQNLSIFEGQRKRVWEFGQNVCSAYCHLNPSSTVPGGGRTA